MTDFNDIAVQARRQGIDSQETSIKLFNANANASVEDVVFAFAVAGYPAVDNLIGTREYLFQRNDFDQSSTARIAQKMKDVKYPENEIQAAVDYFKG